MVKNILYVLGRAPVWLASVALLALMILTFTDVVLRSIFNAPIEVATELTRILMAVMVFSVMPVLSAQGNQINVDLLDGLFDRFNLARWRDAVVSLFCSIILIWPALRIYDLAERSRSYGDVTEYLKFPVHYLGWFIALMTALTALALLGRGLLLLFAPNLLEPKDD